MVGSAKNAGRKNPNFNVFPYPTDRPSFEFSTLCHNKEKSSFREAIYINTFEILKGEQWIFFVDPQHIFGTPYPLHFDLNVSVKTSVSLF